MVEEVWISKPTTTIIDGIEKYSWNQICIKSTYYKNLGLYADCPGGRLPPALILPYGGVYLTIEEYERVKDIPTAICYIADGLKDRLNAQKYYIDAHPSKYSKNQPKYA